MVRRTLTTALFSFAVLALSASQLWAGTYSGQECEYQMDRYTPGSDAMLMSYASPDDVMKHGRYGIGNMADPGTADQNFTMFVRCPLPSSAAGKTIEIAAIDSTTSDDVSCRIVYCSPGIGAGEGECDVSVDTRRQPFNLHSTSNTDKNPNHPYPQGANYVTQNVSLLWIDAPYWTGPSAPPDARRLGFLADLSTAYSLECTLPEPDPSNEASVTDGVSYIQTYTVVEDMDDMDDHGHDH